MPIIKLISLNIYGGKIFEPLVEFLKTNSRDTDIFCLQEVFDTSTNIKESHDIKTNMFKELHNIMPEFRGQFVSIKKGFDLTNPVDFDLGCGITTLLRSRWPIIKQGVSEYKHKLFAQDEAPQGDVDALSSKFQYIQTIIHGKSFMVCNYYGAWYPGSKLDTKERLVQIQLLTSFLAKFPKYNHVILGDFNLLPKTKCIQKIEEAGYVNLIKRYNILTTRGSFGRFLLPQYKNNFQEFTDYVFLSNGVEIVDFQVPDVAISDHLPLILKIRA